MKLDIEPILEKYPAKSRDALIPLLQAVQEKQGYLSKDAIVQIAKRLGLSASKVYGVATFYNQFRFQPLGKYHIAICRGTACHVKGSLSLLETLQNELKIEAGETTRDHLFSLETLACLGACGLSPVMCVNGEFYGRMTPEKTRKLIQDLREEAAKQ